MGTDGVGGGADEACEQVLDVIECLVERVSVEVFRGSLAIGGGQEWSIKSLARWPWTGADSSSITASLSMEDQDGNPAEVTIDITCP